ncbi:O-methyltransferase-domain-containing protein [Chiua virens]|nr:O-methyltransferase-domain-containing protein [Chiua virens]
MSGEAQLEALLEIINTSARQAIAEYKKGGNEVPTIHSKEHHPIDFANDTVALKKAVRLLEGASQQLCASLAPPQHTLQNLAMTFEWACVRVVIRAKIADTLTKYPKGLHVEELAKLANLEKGKLTRVLRLLATKGCFTEGTALFFYFRGALVSRIQQLICNSSRAKCLFEQPYLAYYTLELRCLCPLKYREWATSYHPDKAPLIYALEKKGFKGSFFDWIKQDAEKRENYHRAMIGLGRVMGALSVLDHYPWNDVKTVCDVGASVGTFSIPLSKKYPHLKIIDQDLPEVLVQAKDSSPIASHRSGPKDAPEVLQRNQVEFATLNFFEESPAKGQDVYYLRNIIHDWPDNEAAIILRNIKNAMGTHSRLLIHDIVLTPASYDLKAKSYGADVAPEPLLPNFGNGNNRNYQQDMNMWLIHNAKERTLDDSIALGSIAGLRLEKVYDLAESAVLEFSVAA